MTAFIIKQDEPRTCYTDWNKLEREKQMLYINTHTHTHIYTWNLKRWYWWTYLQDSNGNTDLENGLVDTVGEGENGMNWESSLGTHTLPYVKEIVSGNLLYDAASSNQVLCDNLDGWNGVGGGRWEGGSERKGHMSTCGWFILMYERNQHNIVKWLSSN